jgi:hypothetical protein
MEGQIVDIEYDTLFTDICKIISRQGEDYVVKALVYDPDTFLYQFSHYTHLVPIESVSGFYDTTELEDTANYKKIAHNRYKCLDESDPEYEFESGDDISDDETDSDISLYEEQEYQYE